MGERKALGKGLSALLGRSAGGPASAAAPAPPPAADTGGPGPSPGTGIRMLPVDAIEPNPDQPRGRFGEDGLRELAASIERDGVMQPIVVREETGAFVLIAGERRLRAARLAGLETIPAVTHRLEEPADSLRLALVENIQREDLNPLEEARAYQELIQRCGLTQDQLAQQVSRSRSGVTNSLRLLRLPQEVQALLADGAISMGHARALLATDSTAAQVKLAQRIVTDGLTVRQVERLAAGATPTKSKATPPTSAAPADPYLGSIEAAMRERLGTKVRIRPTSKTTGHILIDYYSPEELEGILARLGVRLPG